MATEELARHEDETKFTSRQWLNLAHLLELAYKRHPEFLTFRISAKVCRMLSALADLRLAVEKAKAEKRKKEKDHA